MFLFFVELVFWTMPSARARYTRLPLANQALRIPIAYFAKFLRLEIGIDGFGVKKHVAS